MMHPIQKKKYNPVWVYLCAYGPVVFTILGGFLLMMGGIHK